MPRPTRLLTTLLALLALALASANTPTRELEANPKYEAPVQLVTTLDGINLKDAPALLGASAGVNILTKDLPEKNVTYRFETPTPFYEVLTVILALEDLVVTETGSTLIVQPAATAPTQASAPASEPREALFHDLGGAPADELTSVITSLHPGVTAQSVNSGTRLLITATPTQHDNIRELITDYKAHMPEPEPEPTEELEPEPEPLVNAFVPVQRGLTDLATLLPDQFPNARIQVVENARAVTITATQAELEAIQAYISEYEVFLQERQDAGAIKSEEIPEIVERTYRISNTSATELAATIQAVLAPAEEGYAATFVPDDRTNKLVVRAPESLIPEVETLVFELDEATKQVRITVRIQEIAQREAENLGLSITANAGALVGSLINGVGQFVFNPARALTALNINAVLDTLEAQSLSRTLDNAVLMVTNNGTATLNSGGNINVAVQIGDGEAARQQSDSISFGTQVTVTPRITNDGRVDLQLTTSVSGFEGELENLTGLRFSDKTLTTNVVVADREVVVIGGLIQNSFVNTIQGVPVLSAIPILGNLFRHDVTENNKSELVIVVTAEIVD